MRRTVLEELVSEERVCGHLGPYSDDTSHDLLVALVLGIRCIEFLGYLWVACMRFLEPTARREV